MAEKESAFGIRKLVLGPWDLAMAHCGYLVNMYARSSLPSTTARLPGFRLLMTLCRSPLDTMISDEIFLDESDFSRLILDGPPVGRQLLEEEAVPEPETCPISPTWASSLWMSDASHQILELRTPSPAGVGNFASQELIGSKTDARGLNESWTAPFPFGASFDVSTSIVHSDANIRVPSLGESLHADQHQDIHLGTHLRYNCIK